MADHAGRHVPPELAGLGLEPAQFDRHIAYDPGTDAVCRGLADRLGARAVLGTYSRLVLDLNRHPDDAGAIPQVSDGVTISANQSLSPADRAHRFATIHQPYHDVIASQLGALSTHNNQPTVLFSVHSFTPVFDHQPRPWDVGVLWNKDPRLAAPLLDHLHQIDGLTVGDNQPYSGQQWAYTLDTHGGDLGRANVAIEIRQDRLTSAQDTDAWASILYKALLDILKHDDLRQIRHY